MNKTILVTGGCGFIGSNFIRCLLKKTDQQVVSFDALTYAGNLENIHDTLGDQHSFVKGSIVSNDDLISLFSSRNIVTVFH